MRRVIGTAVVAAVLVSGCSNQPTEFKSLGEITDRLNEVGWSCQKHVNETDTRRMLDADNHGAAVFCESGTAQLWDTAEERARDGATIPLSVGHCQIEDGKWLVNGPADLVAKAQEELGGTIRCRSASVTTTRSAVAPSVTRSSTPSVSPEVREWMAKVNGNGSYYGPADAESSCERLDEYGDEAAWWAVGDDRLIWAGRLLCVQHRDEVERAVGGFRDGTHAVGSDDGEVAPGSYVSRPGTESCYWERVSGGGSTIANDFVSFAPQGARLTVRGSDAGVKTQGCGPWVSAR